MEVNKLINPIQIGRFNLCPKCITPSLYLVEKNIDMSYIDEIGDPLDYINLSNISYLVCSKCKTKYDYKKKGMKIFIYTDREKKIDEARQILLSESIIKDNKFIRINTDSENLEEDYI